jgi:uncharacterized Tic20 family protein
MNEQQKACTEHREMAPSTLEKARKYRKWNLLFAFAGMIAIVILYIALLLPLFPFWPIKYLF